jgi:hypothetical protein
MNYPPHYPSDGTSEIETASTLSVLLALLEIGGTLRSSRVQILCGSVDVSCENSFAGPAVYSAQHAQRLARILRNNLARDIDVVAWSARCLYEMRRA